MICDDYEIAKANTRQKAFADGIPIGDAIGPMVTASLKTWTAMSCKKVVVSKESLAEAMLCS